MVDGAFVRLRKVASGIGLMAKGLWPCDLMSEYSS